VSWEVETKEGGPRRCEAASGCVPGSREAGDRGGARIAPDDVALERSSEGAPEWIGGAEIVGGGCQRCAVGLGCVLAAGIRGEIRGGGAYCAVYVVGLEKSEGGAPEFAGGVGDAGKEGEEVERSAGQPYDCVLGSSRRENRGGGRKTVGGALTAP